MAKGNSVWLMTAVRYATAARANSLADFPPGARTLWKRLWWCCIVRDRIISLSSRRPLRITRQIFDPTTAPRLTREDLEESVNHAIVHDKPTSERLVGLCLFQIGLVVTLSDVLDVTYPPDGSLVPHITSLQDFADRLFRIEQSRESLKTWFLQLQSPETHHAASSHQSIFLFDQVLRLSYQ